MAKSKGQSHGFSAAATATAIDPSALEAALGHETDPISFCAALAKVFHVRSTEVALLRLEKGLLRFVFPEALKTAGAIPLSSSTAVAAHTAVTKKVELFNAFCKVKHASIFETVKLGKPEDQNDLQAPIQKLISAPVLGLQNEVMGVIQVCRKGFDMPTAGADFTLDDLQSLERAAKVVAKAPFMR